MALTEGHDDVSPTFIRTPNELKLMFAEELGTHDVYVLARTCRQMNELLARFLYVRAKDSKTKWGRPYFLLAVDHGNMAAVKRFVEVGAWMNMTDTATRRPETAIHSCAHFGRVKMAKFLIDQGINISAIGRAGRRALHSTMIGFHPNEAMVTLLVEAGADVNACWGWDTPLHLAASRGYVRMVQRLLDLGADPHATDPAGSTAVHMAAVADYNGAAVRSLLEVGKNVEIADYEGRTPLHGAAEFSMTESVKVLLEMGADASSVDWEGYTPLMLALDADGNEASVHRILHLGASMGEQSCETYADCFPSCQLKQPIHMTIELLLAAGADITKVNYYGDSPLRWALARASPRSFRRAQKTQLPN